VSYVVIPYDAGRRADVAALQTHSWSPDASLNAAYLEWKHEQNPFLRTPLIYLALHHGRVVGMRGFYGASWEADDAAMPKVIPCAADLVVAPEHRNLALVPMIMKTALEDLAARGYEYVLNLSASPVTLLGSLAMGWRSAGSLEETCRIDPGRPDRRAALSRLRRLPVVWRFAGNLAQVVHGVLPGPFAELDRKWARDAGRGTDPIDVERTPRVEAMADLVRRLGTRARIRHVRDTAYLGWRYRNPLAAYRFLYWGNDPLDGYVVLEHSISASADRVTVRVVDWEAARPEIRVALLRSAIRWGRFREIRAWSATQPDGAADVLRQEGFVVVDEPGRLSRHRPALLVRTTRQPEPGCEWTLFDRRLLDRSNWDLRPIAAL